MRHEIELLVQRQERWATPLGTRAQEILKDLFRNRQPIKDALNGTWLGHPVHPAVTDVPVGAMTMASLLDAAGRDTAADLAVATGLAGMAASAATGAADAVDAQGRPQVLATVHATLMATSATAYAASVVLRVGPGRGRPMARLLALAGYGALTAGAYVGGHLTYRYGHQVDRHAFESPGTKWRKLDVGDVPPGTLVRAKAGSDMLLLYRSADHEPVQGIHGVCSHEGGPLHKGDIVDGCVECPWHGSRFRLADGRLQRGPAVYDQPRFEVRSTADGGLEARRVPSPA